ncbi:hypothetical protein CWE12_09755 [Aliidiomarina sedimenti]|uniref:Uncharacterized protein n=1 Tax=Aliidiomarina sedimenti TaxID=1933879 RepID=A0ABY0BXV4_9GAMM|nr:hypothetical protein [Aliidiomarina sedimenti]RUO29259.1 hypothetical protein CWE12_09755 [Aliidiomarina sedimenti]
MPPIIKPAWILCAVLVLPLSADANTPQGAHTKGTPAPYFDDYAPGSLEATVAFFAEHNLLVEKRTNQVAVPFLVGAYEREDLEQTFNDDIKRFTTEFGLTLEDIANRHRDQADNGIHRQAGMAYFSGDYQTLEHLRANLKGRFYVSD